MPSFLGAVGAVLLTYWAALAFVSRRAAVLAALMLAVSMLLGVEARLAKTDAALLAACVAAMGALGRAYLGGQGALREEKNPWLAPAVFWTALAAGVLLKGPLIFMFAAFDGGDACRARQIGGVAATAEARHRHCLDDPARAAVVRRDRVAQRLELFHAPLSDDDMFAKVGGGQESHGMPPGYYLLLFWVTFFPGAILAGSGDAGDLAFAARARREISAGVDRAGVDRVRDVATKLPHYVLPLYPAIAIMLAGVVDHHGLSQRPWLVRGTVWWFLITALLVTAIDRGAMS